MDQFTGYSQLHRKPRYTQPGGGGGMRPPTRISLESMYGQRATPQFQVPQITVPPYTKTLPRQPRPADVEKYVTERGYAQDRETGVWFPATPTEGQTYQSGDKQWIYQEGEWEEYTGRRDIDILNEEIRSLKGNLKDYRRSLENVEALLDNPWLKADDRTSLKTEEMQF